MEKKTEQICVWKDAYTKAKEGRGTTAIDWGPDHPCAKCDGYRQECGTYRPVD